MGAPSKEALKFDLRIMKTSFILHVMDGEGMSKKTIQEVFDAYSPQFESVPSGYLSLKILRNVLAIYAVNFDPAIRTEVASSVSDLITTTLLDNPGFGWYYMSDEAVSAVALPNKPNPLRVPLQGFIGECGVMIPPKTHSLQAGGSEVMAIGFRTSTAEQNDKPLGISRTVNQPIRYPAKSNLSPSQIRFSWVAYMNYATIYGGNIILTPTLSDTGAPQYKLFMGHRNSYDPHDPTDIYTELNESENLAWFSLCMAQRTATPFKGTGKAKAKGFGSPKKKDVPVPWIIE